MSDHIDHSGPDDRRRTLYDLGDRCLKQQDQVRRDHVPQGRHQGVPLCESGQADSNEQFIGVIVQDDLEVVADRGPIDD